MTNEEAIEILEEVKTIDDSIYQYNPKYMDALDMALTALDAEEAHKENTLDQHEIWKISSVFQNYYCIGLSEIAEEDEVCCSLFEKLGLL